MEPFSFIPHWGIYLFTARLHVNMNSFLFAWIVKLLLTQKSANEWFLGQKTPLHMYTVNHFFLLLLRGQTTGGKKRWLSRQPLWRNGFTGGGLWSNFPFIFGTVSSSNPFFSFFLTEVSVIRSILKLHLNGFPMSLLSVSHSHTGLTPHPPYFSFERMNGC